MKKDPPYICIVKGFQLVTSEDWYVKNQETLTRICHFFHCIITHHIRKGAGLSSFRLNQCFIVKDEFMKTFIPENLDVDVIIKENPPQIKRFHKDKLISIISLIHEKYETLSKIRKGMEYAPIRSTIFQNNIAHDYTKYLDYLEKVGIIERDRCYQAGKYSMGYRLNETYRETKIKANPDEVTYFPIIKKMRQKSGKKSTTIYPFMDKWFNHNLQIDLDKALKLAEMNYEYELEHPRYEETHSGFKMKNSISSYNSTVMNIHKLAERQFNLSVDPTVFRYHSNLTNLKEDIRTCITYNNQPLVEIDIKNSQPYFSTALFQTENYSQNTEKQKIILYKSENITFQIQSTTNITTKPTLPIPIHNYPSNHPLFLSPMLEKFLKKADREDIRVYVDLIGKGKLYERINEIINDELGINYDKKQLKKSVIFPVFFSSNHVIGQGRGYAKFKKIFRKYFPNVYEAFKIIKRNDKTALACLLQRMESYMVIEVICRRIARERPDLPLFTIHDSIVTTQGNEQYVKSVMEEELERFVDIRSMLKINRWAPEEVRRIAA